MDTISFTLPSNGDKIDLQNISFLCSSYIQEPMIALGFNLFMMKNKEKLQIVKNLPESQKKVHYIFNDYDVFLVSQPEKSIHETFQKLVFKKPLAITNSSFYKIWEIISEFSLLSSKEPIIAISMGDGPGSIVQSLITYRNTYHSKLVSKDLYCVLGIIDDQKLECFTNMNIFNVKDENKMRDYNDIKIFKKDFLKKTKEQFGQKKKNANLIVCDGEMNWYDENYQEQEMINLIFSEIVFGLNMLDEGGSLVVKIYDTYTLVTVKILAILNSFFKDVYIYKPLTSSRANSEKYVVGKGYKPNKSNILVLNKLFEDIEKNQSFIVDINNFDVEDKIMNMLINVNQQVSDLQYQIINRMYKFIQTKNYFGVEYHDQVKKQVEHSAKWIEKYVKL
jgi:23S rRNA U2552 (ribose-2'-O)-methylase RlmE/FtsJ